MLRRSFAASFALAVLAVPGLAGSAVAAPPDFAPPDEQGPFNVGVTTFSATMTTGRVTRIQVFYPTLEDRDEESTYKITSAVGTYQITSILGAVHNAEAAPGFFPLVVHDHGGGLAGPDWQRVSQHPLHEVMASHGFVVVVALHSASPAARIRDLSVVIDVMLARSADDHDLLCDSINLDRIGISGISAGGAAAIGAAGGWAANDIERDPRIRAMTLYEPTIPSLDDASTITVPYLVMGGMQHATGRAIPMLSNATELATPRIFVLTPSATHFNYMTGMGRVIDQTREQALLMHPDIPEPLTTFVPDNAAAAQAYELWNMGEILFPLLGPGAGSGRNFCDRVGVDSVRSLDADGDGFTDSPPLLLDDPLLPLGRATPEEVMVPLIKLYTVSFWKAFLEGDRRYMAYLTPGYAGRNDLEAFVEIESHSGAIRASKRKRPMRP